jgi:hypothetical protein
MLEQSDQTPYNAAVQIGRRNTYVYNILNRDTDVKTATMAAIARVCGYRLALVGRGEELELDPAPLTPKHQGD